jgi:voltage-gated potassium channel Kch
MAKKDKSVSLEESISDVLGVMGEESTEDTETELKGEESDEVVADTDTDKGETVAETTTEDSGDTPSESKYKIGEDEYTADELLLLMEKGKLAKKVEEEQKLDIGQLLPEFTRRSQLLKNKDGLKEYYKSTFREEVDGQPSGVSEEQKRIKAEIEAARKLGFTTKDDLEEFRAAIKQEIKEEVEQENLSKVIDKATVQHGVGRQELIEFMLALRMEDPLEAAEKLGKYKKFAVERPKIVVPTKPEVLSTEKKGSGLRVPQKERPIPHPEKDPEGFEARILEFLEHKTPEEV